MFLYYPRLLNPTLFRLSGIVASAVLLFVPRKHLLILFCKGKERGEGHESAPFVFYRWGRRRERAQYNACLCCTHSRYFPRLLSLFFPDTMRDFGLTDASPTAPGEDALPSATATTSAAAFLATAPFFMAPPPPGVTTADGEESAAAESENATASSSGNTTGNPLAWPPFPHDEQEGIAYWALLLMVVLCKVHPCVNQKAQTRQT